MLNNQLKPIPKTIPAHLLKWISGGSREARPHKPK